MRVCGKALMSLSVAIIAAWAVITALKWPFMSAIFVVIVGIIVFLIAAVDFCLRLFGSRTAETSFKFSENMGRTLAIRRALSALMFIIGFFLMILFLGFPIAVPLFIFLYLKLHAKENWRISLGLAAVAWVCFFGLFIWLLKTPFMEGWVQRWIRTGAIG